MLNSLSTIILVAVVILNISCQSNGSKNSPAQAVNDPGISATAKDKSSVDTLPSSKELNLATVKNIEVLSAGKKAPKDSTGENHTTCKAWSLTAKQVESLIRKFTQTTSEEQYLSHSFYDCDMTGEVNIDQVKYRYWMGAGGTLTLENSGTTFYYGCQDEKCRQYFISIKLTDKELHDK